MGVPAAATLLILVIAAYIYGYRNVKVGTDRALRMACLAASALVPLHGFFDVPGRQPALFWACIFLFAIALNPISRRERSPRLLPWISRGAGALVAFGGLWLLGVGWSQLGVPAVVRANDDHQNGFQLYKTLRDPKREIGIWQVQHERKQLDEAMRQAIPTTPLNRSLYFLEGAALVANQTDRPRADQAFAINRALAPRRVDLPLLQATEWMGYDSQRIGPLWKIALERAGESERVYKNSSFSTKRVTDRIKRVVKKSPKLKPAAEEAGVGS